MSQKYDKYLEWEKEQKKKYAAVTTPASAAVPTYDPETFNWDNLASTNSQRGKVTWGSTGSKITGAGRKIGPGTGVSSVESDNIMDSNFLFDFLGNAAWGFGETFVVPTVLDIASETKEGGIDTPFGKTQDLSAAFGSQDWKDESLAGKFGYLVGTGLGIFTGIGAVGKGLQVVSKLSGAGTKLATKKGLKELAETGIKQVSTKGAQGVVKNTRQLIQKAQKEQIKRLKFIEKLNPMGTAKGLIKGNPLNNPTISNTVKTEIRDSVKKITGASGKALDDAVETFMKVSSESLPQHFGHSTAYMLSTRLGINSSAAKWMGDMWYEAHLLGIWDMVAGEVGDLAADTMDLNEQQWHFEDAYKRYIHGMRTGSLLATTRYIPGGKKVVFGQSGMIADIGMMGTLVRNRFLRTTDKMNVNQLKGFAHTITTQGGKWVDDAFSHIPGYSRARLQQIMKTADNKLAIADRELLETIWKTARKDVPKHLFTLTKEIGKDGIGSFSRAFAGATVMMAPAYKDAYDQGVLGTEEYPWDKVFVDQWVGMMYMKRGKNLANYKTQPRKYGESFFKERSIETQAETNLFGKTPTGRFYNETGMEMDGTEISRMIQAYKVLGYKDKWLDALNANAYTELGETLKRLQGREVENAQDVMTIIDRIRKNFLDVGENNERVNLDHQQNVVQNKGKATLNNWEHWLQKHIGRRTEREESLRKDGKLTEADRVQKEVAELIDLNLILQEMQVLALEGYNGKTTKFMTEVEALDFVEQFRQIKLTNGEPLNLNTYNHLTEQFFESKMKIAADIEGAVIPHIFQSLKLLGLANDKSLVNGKLVIHETVVKTALEQIREHRDPSAPTGKEKAYYEAANTLLEAIEQGKNRNLIEVSADAPVRFDPLQNVFNSKKADFSKFKELWVNNTEMMHEMIWNPEFAKEESWRNHVPGWANKKAGEFLDPMLLGQAAIWDSIGDAHRYRRNEQTYNSILGKGKDQVSQELFTFIKERLEGNVSFKAVEDVLAKVKELKDLDLSSKADVDLSMFFTNFNTVLEMLSLNSSGRGSRKNIDRAQLEAIKDKVEEMVGNVFHDSAEFQAFTNFVSHKFIQDITSNMNIGTPQRKALLQLLGTDSLLGLKMNNRLNIRSSKALRETLLGDPNIGSSERAQLEAMIKEYEVRVETPLTLALKDNPALVSFIDARLDLTIDSYKRNDLIQEIKEITGTYTATSTTDLISWYRKSNKMGVAFADLDAKIQQLELELASNAPREQKKTMKEVRDAFIELSREGENMTIVLQTLIANKDFIGIKEFINASNAIDNLSKNILAVSSVDSKNILDFKNTIRDYVVNAINKRNQLLRIDTIQEVNDFYDNQMSELKLADRSGRPHSMNTTMSKQQYSMKWNLSQEYMDNLITKPVLLLEGIQGKKYKQGDQYFDLVNEGIGKVLDGTFSIKDYVDIVLEPIIKLKKVEIETLINAAKFDKNKQPPGTYEDYVLDSYHVVTSAMSTKQVPIAVYENGRLTIKRTSISTWDAGINSLSRLLGLDQNIGQIMLFGSTIGVENGWTSRLTSELRAKIEAELSSGTPVDIAYQELLKTKDQTMLDLYKELYVGEGKDASQQFFMTRIDDKSVVLVPSIAKDKIVQTIGNPNSEIRVMLKNIIRSANDNKNTGARMTDAQAEIAVQQFLKTIMPKADFVNGQLASIKISSKEAADIIQLARAANAMPTDLIRHINGEMTMKDILSALKYIKLDNPRSGLAMNNQNLEFGREFLPRFIGKDSKMMTAYDIYLNHTRKNGKNTKRKDLNIFDEGAADIKSFFDSKSVSRSTLERQLKMNNPGLTKAERDKRIDDALAVHDGMPASIQNGAKYLSLPEMVSTLMAKGARKEWFIWEKNAETGKWDIVGVNVAVKPIEMHHTVDAATGRIEVHIGKTAYVYHPKMDALMKNANGDYFVDAIGFTSTHKRHEIYNPVTRQIEQKGVSIDRRNDGDWINDGSLRDIYESSIGALNLKTPKEIFEINRDALFIKSIVGEHDGTISAGFANLLSNQALGSLNNVSGIRRTQNDLMERFQYLAANPMAYKAITEKLLMGTKESGDNVGKVLGVEQILAVDGMPIFEFMLPNIERMVSTEYLGNRNLITSRLANGAYPVMTPGGGFSMPVRLEGVQYGFGGSGISSKEWTQPLDNFMLLRKNGQGVFEVNNSEALSMVFKVTKDFLKKTGVDKEMLKDFEGSDFAISFEQGGKISIVGPHMSKKWDNANNKKLFETIEKQLEKDFGFLMEWAAADGSIATLGDLALFLNGTRKEYVDNNRDYELNASLYNKKTDNGDAAYNLFRNKKDGDMYSQIHLAKVDLRQPKPGINDWVITRVERLLDKRRGPVSEMNLMDVINPQDADFDLDKSSSFYALPGRVIKDIYTVSGYQQSTKAIFETALQEAGLLEGKEFYSELNAMWEGKRAPTLRQISILSTMLQYYSTKSRTGSLFEPGWLTGQPRESRFELGPKGGFDVTDARNVKYEFAIRDGLELVNSLEYVKQLVKASIDIYKDPQKMQDISIDKLIWEHADLGFIQIKKYTGSDKKGEFVTYEQMSAEGQAIFNTIKEKILKPIGKLHDLNLMSESYQDGTSRKLSAFEMVHRYESILNDVYSAGWRYEWSDKQKKYIRKATALKPLVEPLLHFLGQTKVGSGQVSEMPLIQALKGLREGMTDVFTDMPSTETGLGLYLLGAARQTPENVNRAVAGILFDQKTAVQIGNIKYRHDQAKDIYYELVAMRKGDTSTAKYWKSQIEKYEPLILEYNNKINNPEVVYQQNSFNAKKKPGKQLYPMDNVAVFSVFGAGTDKESIKRVDYKPGKLVEWKPGDVVIVNPQTLVAGNKQAQMVRSAMHNAFARFDGRLGNNELLRVDMIVNEFKAALANPNNKLIDPNRPLDSHRFGIKGEGELAIMSEWIERAGAINPMNKDLLMQTFLHKLLIPNVSRNEWAVRGYDPVRQSLNTTVNYKSNKYYESLVFKFLNRAMEQNGSSVLNDKTAKGWHQTINDRFKTALIREWDPTRIGDLFNFEKTTREVDNFSLQPPRQNLPKFLGQDGLNVKAKELLHSYVMGTYFLDPIQIYRLTAGLKENIPLGTGVNLPPRPVISEVVKTFWEGMDPVVYKGGNIYKPLHSYRNQVYHTTPKGAERASDWFRNFREKNCNY